MAPPYTATRVPWTPLQEAPTAQASPSANPDEEGEHMTDAESPNPVEDLSVSLSSTRVTLEGGPNAQLYIYHLRLRPLAAN